MGYTQAAKGFGLDLPMWWGGRSPMIGPMRLAWTLCLMLAACSSVPEAAPVGGGGGGGPVGAVAPACPVDLLAALDETLARVTDPESARILEPLVSNLKRPALAGASLTARTQAVAFLEDAVDDLATRGRLDPALVADFRDLTGCLHQSFSSR
jgi:hypothetical protein